MHIGRVAFGLCCALFTSTALAQPTVPITAQPQWTHRREMAAVTFDQSDGDRRAAMLDMAGNCAVIDMATGTVLAARRFARVFEVSVRSFELVGDEVRAVFQEGDYEIFRWRWQDDVLQSKRIENDFDAQVIGVAGSPTHFEDHALLGESHLRIVAANGSVRRVPVANAREVHWVTEHLLVLRFENHVEVRDVRRPRRVAHRYDGRSMAIGWGKLAVAHYTQVSVFDFESGEEQVLPHGRDQVSVDVVVGEDAAAVYFGVDTAFVPFDGSRPRSVQGHARWVGPRTALVVEGETVFRVSRSNGRRRRAGTLSESMYAGPAPFWSGFHGGFAVLSDNMEEATLFRPNGRRITPRRGGPHSVWHSDVLEDGRVVLAGRFGTQIWSANGVEDMTSCRGERLLGTHEGAILTEVGRCTPSRVRPWPGDATALARSGTHVVLSTAKVLDLSSGRQTSLPGLSAQVCDEEMGFCSWTAEFMGPLIVVTRGEGGSLVLTPSGRRLLSVPEGTRVAASADGSRVAVHHLRGGRVLSASGDEVFRFGERHGAAAVSGAVFRRDGRTLAWLADRETVEMLGPDGRSIWRAPVPVGTRIHEVIGRRIRITSPDGAWMVSSQTRTPLPADISSTIARCVQGHFMYLDGRGEPVRGAECSEGSADVHGATLIARVGGIATIYRGGHAITVGSIRTGSRARHFAFARGGAWWAPHEGTLAWRQGRQVVEAPEPASQVLRRLFPTSSSSGE